MRKRKIKKYKTRKPKKIKFEFLPVDKYKDEKDSCRICGGNYWECPLNERITS